MLEVERQITIACQPQDWLDLVLDVHRYRLVDDKIGKIAWTRRNDDLVEFKFKGVMPGLRLPPMSLVSQMRLTPGDHVDVALAPLPRNAAMHLASRFAARFSAQAVPDGTRVRRYIRFDFPAPLRWAIEPPLQRALPASVERELGLAKQMLEGNGAGRGD